MGSFSSASKACTALILIAINCLLLAGGVLVLYGSIHAKNTGWIDVVDSYWSSADKVLTALTVVGGVIIGLAVLGSVAACCRWRVGLLIYAWVVFVVFALFVAVTVVAFMTRSKAEDWKSKPFPADTDETTVKTEFDRVYCYAQGAYICNEMNVTEAASIFYPNFATSSLLAPFADLKGVNAMCAAFSNLVPQLQSACDGCAAAKAAENLTSVLDWANSECPRTAPTLLWCGTFLGSSNASLITVGMAPYKQCRSEFLGLISSSALTLGVGGAIICAGAFLVILFSCYLRRSETNEREYENVAYGTPQTGSAYNTPQTAEPFYGNQRSNDQLYSKV